MKKLKITGRTVPGIIGALCMCLILTASAFSVNAGEHHNMNMSAEEDAGRISPGIITADMKCPVCGMYPARYPKWHSQIVFSDGSIEAFDGCKDLFTYLLDMRKYDRGRSREDVAAVFVKDFISGHWINAKDAHFVAGSGMPGPMGKEIIPFAGHMPAMKFQEKHGGSMITYSEITMKTIMSLKSGKMKMHKHDGHMEEHGDH